VLQYFWCTIFKNGGLKAMPINFATFFVHWQSLLFEAL